MKKIIALVLLLSLAVSLLAACGQGKIHPESIPALLAARDRRAVPSVTAPAGGLALVRVEYPQ